MAYTYAKPHSKDAWMALPEGKQGFKNYDRYLSWWKSTVAPKFTVSDDPFAATPVAAQRAQAQEQVGAVINPLIKAFEDSITRRSKEGGRAIGSATDAFVKGVSPLADNLGAVHDTSIQGVQGVNDSLTKFVKDTGGYVASQLGAMIPEKDSGAVTAGAEQFGTGLSGQQLAQGASTISRMYAERAADTAYGEKMPGYARAFGTEAVNDYERQLNLQRQEGLEGIRSQIPSLVSSVLQNLSNNELAKATARKGFELDEDKMNQPATPDYSWMTGPASQQYVVNPATGQQYANPNYQAGGGSTVNQGGLTKARQSAQKLHDQMMETFRGGEFGLNTPTSQEKTAILRANREKVRLQVVADLKSFYPNKGNDWITQQATAILAATGWPAVASALSKGTPMTQAPSTATPAAAPTVQPSRPGQPKPPSSHVNPDARDRADTKQAIADARVKKEREAIKAIKNTVQQMTSLGETTRGQAKKVVIENLQGILKGWPYKRIIALANGIIEETYGNTLYGK